MHQSKIEIPGHRREPDEPATTLASHNLPHLSTSKTNDQVSSSKPINNLPRPQHRRHLLALSNHLRLAFTLQQPGRKVADPRC
jgi:hypothetical protein